MSQAPFANVGKQVLFYHDLGINEKFWDAILFADPTMKPHGKWHPIGRPIPEFKPEKAHYHHDHSNDGPVIGCHGFLGAWADNVVSIVMKEFEYATVRLHLPFSPFCDPAGAMALETARHCRQMIDPARIHLDITHDFMTQPQLLEWLSQNDLNAYLRPVGMNWNGVSSACDCALAVRKPIAINRSNAFRHLHGTNPSICVEDCTLSDIISNGLDPLIPAYQAWSPENIRRQVEEVLLSL